jgi:hypothetical protein
LQENIFVLHGHTLQNNVPLQWTKKVVFIESNAPQRGKMAGELRSNPKIKRNLSEKDLPQKFRTDNVVTNGSIRPVCFFAEGYFVLHQEISANFCGLSASAFQFSGSSGVSVLDTRTGEHELRRIQIVLLVLCALALAPNAGVARNPDDSFFVVRCFF